MNKNFIRFFWSVLLSLLIFAGVIFAVLFASRPQASEEQPAVSQKHIGKYAVIFTYDDPDLLSSPLFAVSLWEMEKNTVTIYSTDEFSTLSALEAAVVKDFAPDSLKFVKFSEKNFAQIADRMGGVVYNDGEVNERYTGYQLTASINSEVFTKTIIGYLSFFFKSENRKNEFYHFVNSVETDISFVNFYDYREFYPEVKEETR